MTTREIVRLAVAEGLTAKQAAIKYDRSLRSLQVAADRMGVSFKWEGIGRPPKSGLSIEQRLSIRVSSMSNRVRFLLACIDGAIEDLDQGRVPICRTRLDAAREFIRKERNRIKDPFE